MKKFQSNVNRELRRAYPDRRRLETQCLSLVAFVKSENDILDCPIWVLIVNVVAMDMLKSKLPPGKCVFGTQLKPPHRPAADRISIIIITKYERICIGFYEETIIIVCFQSPFVWSSCCGQLVMMKTGKHSLE